MDDTVFRAYPLTIISTTGDPNSFVVLVIRLPVEFRQIVIYSDDCGETRMEVKQLNYEALGTSKRPIYSAEL